MKFTPRGVSNRIRFMTWSKALSMLTVLMLAAGCGVFAAQSAKEATPFVEIVSGLAKRLVDGHRQLLP